MYYIMYSSEHLDGYNLSVHATKGSAEMWLAAYMKDKGFNCRVFKGQELKIQEVNNPQYKIIEEIK